jgi:hypothetical protein
MDWYQAASEYYRSTPDGAGVSSLPSEWQRELVALMLVNREVNNGGYLQFLANHGLAAYRNASRALKAIGAHQMADIIDRCQTLIDEHFVCDGRSSGELLRLLRNQVIGYDGRTIKEAGSALPESVLARVSELSYEFMDFPENVGELAQSHYGPLIEADK